MFVEIEDCECIHGTDQAILVVVDNEEVWVPRSLIDKRNSEVLKKHDSGTLIIPEWFALQKGWI